MSVALAVVLGGALGALSRYGVMALVERRTVAVFPWDVFVVNMTDWFLAGLVVSALVDGHEAPAWFRVGLVLAFIGVHDLLDIRAASLRPGRGTAARRRGGESLRERRHRSARRRGGNLARPPALTAGLEARPLRALVSAHSAHGRGGIVGNKGCDRSRALRLY